MASIGLDSWRFVLLGKTGVGKSASGNTILGEKLFKSETRASSVTTHCNIQTREINKKMITVMDTTGLYDTNMSKEKIKKETVQCLQLIAPGPHAFLLVIDTRRFTEEDKNTVRNIQEIFGEGVYKYMIVLFTHGDDLEFDNKSIDTFIIDSGPELQQLISACGGRYHVFNNRRPNNRTQVHLLLKMVSRMLEENDPGYYSHGLFQNAVTIKEQKTQRKNQEQHLAELKAKLCKLQITKSNLEPWRFVLLGKTGVGKSATGNTILGEKLFQSETRALSVTIECTVQTREINQKNITVMDTPGLYDTKMSNETILNETVHGLQIIAPGPHAFILVIDTRRFTEEEQNTVKNFQEIFGEGVYKYMIVLFTHGDDLEFDNKSIDTFISDAGHELQQLISACGGRYHVFNNRRPDNRLQVHILLEKVYKMLEENKHAYYSYDLFTMAKEINDQKTQTKNQEQTIAELEATLREQQKIPELKATLREQQKIAELEATLRERQKIPELEATVREQQKIAELEATLRERQKKSSNKSCNIL